MRSYSAERLTAFASIFGPHTAQYDVTDIFQALAIGIERISKSNQPSMHAYVAESSADGVEHYFPPSEF